jgi:hypothetical protein
MARYVGIGVLVVFYAGLLGLCAAKLGLANVLFWTAGLLGASIVLGSAAVMAITGRWAFWR